MNAAVGDVTLDNRVVDLPGEALLELSFEVRPREIRRWITVARPTGDVNTRPALDIAALVEDERNRWP